jgi:Anti-sigma factor NepR
MADKTKQVIEAPTAQMANLDGYALSPIVQDEIGRRLRAVYGKIAAEPLPEKFAKLLDQLAKSDETDEADRESET